MKTLFRRIRAAVLLVGFSITTCLWATPSITITSPASGSTIPSINSPAGFTITANATPTSGASIVSVQFFDNGVSIGTVGGTSPFSITWLPTTAGTHTLTATVTDNSVPTTGTSPSVNTSTATSIVTVTTTRVVALATSIGNSSVAQDSEIFLRANAALSDTVIDRVEFYVDGTLVGSKAQAPYNLAVVLSAANGFTVGPRALTATAFNSDGSVSVTSAPLTLNVAAPVAGDSPPSITLAAPANNATVQINANVTLTATASDASPGFIPAGAGGGVTFFVDGDPVVPVGTGETNPDLVAPYSVTWRPTVIKSYSLRAQTIDDKNNVVLSAPITLTAAASLPTPSVAITAPSNNATVAVGNPVTVTATASASGGATVAKVDFLNGTTLIGTVNALGPFTISWTPSAAGAASLTARVTDSNGTVVTSNPVNVTVAASATPPSIQLTSPPPGRIVSIGSTVALAANALANGGATVAAVEFLVGNTVVSSTTAPTAGNSFTGTWTPTTAGSASISARVTDSNGVQATSSAVGITVAAAPTAVLTAPSANAQLAAGSSVTLSANGTAGTGLSVTNVQFFANGSLIGSTNSSPYTITWVPTTAGATTLTVRVSDSAGATVTSAAVNVNVTGGAEPTATTLALSLSPSTSTTLPQGASRYILANAAPGSGRAIASVEFFVDGGSVAIRQSPPYSYLFTAPGSSGTSTVRVRATDNGGFSLDREIVFTMVSAVGAPPTINLISPAPNTVVIPGAATTVPLVATANDSDGLVAHVQFYARGEPVGALDSAAPYQASFSPLNPGLYTLEAIATDDKGNTTLSNAVTLTAAFAMPSVAITSPSPAATARATPNVPLNIQATAQGGGGAGVLLVEFLLDGVPIGVVNTPTVANGSVYLFRFTPTTAMLGPHTIVARVTDNNSQTASSAPLNLTVANAVGTPPNVSIALPAPGTAPGQLGNLQSLSTVSFVATAAPTTTGVTISSVEFFLNDISIGTGTREQQTNLYRLAYDLSRFDFSVLTPAQDTGRYSVPLYAIARDSNGNQTVASPVTLIVNPSISAPPTVQLQNLLGTTTITQGQQFPLGVVANDVDGTVTTVQLYANSTLVATQPNPQPGQLLTYNAATAGRFNLYAIATDDTGNTAVSTPVITLQVDPVVAPTTSITRPADNATVTSVGAPVFLEGTATTASPAQVATLAFVVTGTGGANRATINAQRVGTTNTYRAIWTPNAADSYSVSTQASVGTAQSTSTVSRRVVVNNLSGLAPTATINVPNTVTTASNVNFTANATDSDGSVVAVEFFLNRNSVGQAVRDPQGNSWRLTANFAGVPTGSAEVVALATDSSGNVAASPTSVITVVAASSIAPSISITPSTQNAAFNRQVQLRANARDTDGVVTSVQYFANATNLGQSGNPGTNYQVNWTPNVSGKFNVWAIVTDNTGNTTVAPTVEVTVRRNNPILEDAAFILQSYQDIANTTNINPLVFDDLDARLGAGTLSRADLILTLVDEPGFLPPVQLLAAYYVIMGQWPTPANYNALIGTARGSLANAIGSILSSNEYFAKFGTPPTVALLNNPASAVPADAFIARLWQSAGLGTPSAQANVAFRNNNVLMPTLGRGYNVVGLNSALAEFITNTNSTNAALYRRARAAALYYQLLRPPVTVTTEQIAARVTALAELSTEKAMIESVLRDVLYGYRYVTITKHPESLTVAPRSGALFTVEAQGAPPLAYQWLLNGAPIPGATNALLSLTNVDASRVGNYTVAVTSSAATATSDAATLTLTTTPTRLANISTRGVTSSGANVLIGGFIVTGANAQQTRQMLIRVAGPRLGAAPFNVTGFLANPRLEVYSGNSAVPLLTNDDWGTQTGGAAQVTAIQQAINRAGAFTFSAQNSADAAVLATLPPGPYTVQAHGPANNPTASGVVLIEVYDVTQGGAAGPKAANVSTRGVVGTGGNILIAGFVVNGAASRRMLIRGVGPTLSGFGLAPATLLADPQLTLIEQSTGRMIRANDDWASGEDAPVIAQAAQTAGAFPLANGSKDAAMLLMLAPGAYTVQLSGVGNATGIAIVEVYDVDP